ncbi:hypothetical protein [Clostridium tetani]|uniref:hypothetical protein n=1 Tax=Clostridium tetani TaxID=1513 RepID=UPI000AC80659|nr:hypothetical protein [Clostridium tetani]WFN60848.1 hypothetical protein PAA20_07830 [Clostridium tetani]
MKLNIKIINAKYIFTFNIAFRIPRTNDIAGYAKNIKSIINPLKVSLPYLKII